MVKFFSLIIFEFALPFNFALASDPKNIYYQRDVKNYTDQVLDFLFGRHKYIHKESSSLQFWSVYLCYGFTYLFLCSSRFDWQNQFLFSEKLASYWLLTFYVLSFFPMKRSIFHWNSAAQTCKEKLWLKVAGEYQISKSPFF